MIDTGNLSWVLVIAITFVPMFICASVLHSKGTIGVLAVVGAIGIAVVVISEFEGWRLALGGISALVGLAVGGNLSDASDLKRKRREQEERRRR